MAETKSKSAVLVTILVLALLGLAIWWLWVRGTVVERPGENGETEAQSITISGVGFSTPESVQHDDVADLYLVSNINGAPLEENGAGFISQVNPDGEVVNLKWIDGEDEDVELNAPKGMGIAGDDLYVADIDVVRVFNRDTGEPVRSVPIEGATFLNGIAVNEDGVVFVSDSGLNADFEGTGTDAIYRIEGDSVETRVADTDLSNPNGLAVHSDGESLMMVPFGSNQVFHINFDGTFFAVGEGLPGGGLDGLAWLEVDTVMLISSWEEQAVYRVDHDGGEVLETVVEGVTAPADIGFDAGRNRVLIPLFETDIVEIRTVSATPANDTETGDNQ